jgi:RHS repeat-associated protein
LICQTGYSYDALGRLTGASIPGAEQTFGYDGFGNLTSKNGATIPVEPATNRLVGVPYDANGNETAGGRTFDVENRVVRPTSGDGADVYGYDASNRRVYVGKNDGYGDLRYEQVTFYDWSGKRLGVYERWVSGGELGPFALKERKVYFGGKLTEADGKLVVTDRLGSVVMYGVNPAQRLQYYPYGEERPGATTQGREKFATYLRDANGIDYAMNRYYDSTRGRFLTPDPYQASGGHADPRSWNRYVYVLGDPISFHDSRGLQAESPPVNPYRELLRLLMTSLQLTPANPSDEDDELERAALRTTHDFRWASYDALSSLGGGCLRVFLDQKHRHGHFTSFLQELMVHAQSTIYYDTTQGEGGQTVQKASRGMYSSTQTVADYLGDANAGVIPGTNVILIGAGFYTNANTGEGRSLAELRVTILHELVHRASGLSHAGLLKAFGGIDVDATVTEDQASYMFSDWLLNDCGDNATQ